MLYFPLLSCFSSLCYSPHIWISLVCNNCLQLGLLGRPEERIWKGHWCTLLLVIYRTFSKVEKRCNYSCSKMSWRSITCFNTCFIWLYFLETASLCKIGGGLRTSWPFLDPAAYNGSLVHWVDFFFIWLWFELVCINISTWLLFMEVN